MQLICKLTQADVVDIIANKYSVLKNDVSIYTTSHNTIEVEVILPSELLATFQSSDVSDQSDCADELNADVPPVDDEVASTSDWVVDEFEFVSDNLLESQEVPSCSEDSPAVNSDESSPQSSSPVNESAEPSNVVDHYSLAAQEARYLTITDDIIKEHLVNGGTIASLCDKFDLIETRYSGRLFKRGSRLRSEDASIPRHGRRAEENSTKTSYTT